MKVTFPALIKSKTEKVDVDECITGKLVIEYVPTNEVRKKLIDIFQPETGVIVTIETQNG